jgi:ATPase subunit of ABC transporter with duplicated ATPase domains
LVVASDRSENIHGSDVSDRAEMLLYRLGSDSARIILSCSQLSGDQRLRFCLAQLGMNPAVMLLIDKPTNHIDK